MEVSVSGLRANLRTCLETVRSGEDVVVTDRGIPVARVVAIDAAPLLERLEREGVITRATSPRRKAATVPRIKAKGPVAELVSELRRSR